MEIRAVDVLTMAATIYGEARGTTQIDREDVAQVIINRWRDGPGWMKSQKNDGILDLTIEAVCRDPWQFSCWNMNDSNYPKVTRMLKTPMKSLENPAFRNCLEAALRMLNGNGNNRVGKSLHYHSKSMEFPSAWGTPVEPKRDNGHHIFYEGVK